VIRKTFLSGLFLLATSMHVGQATDPASAPPGTHGLDVKTQAGEQALLSTPAIRTFLSAIRADKFQIHQGRMYQPDIRLLACMGILPSCNGNNNKNPYLVATVPTPGRPYDPRLPTLNFQMREDEAVVLIGRTPPPVSYFSFRTFVVNRWVERESVRRKVFPSLGDPNNMLTFNTLGKSKGDPFDRAFVLMIVSDKGTEARIRKALKTAGFLDEIINRDVISPNLAKMSSKSNGDFDEEKDDDFTALMRFALWEYGYEEAGQEYLDNPPVVVLRLTPNPRTEKASYSPIPLDRLRPRGTGLTELDLTPEVDALRAGILARYPQMEADELRPTTWLEESFVALQKDLDVLGESRDTVYLRSEGTFTLAEDEFLMVYGVNHEATGKATYANFAIYDVCKACPYAGENSRRVAGSALEYFPDPDPKKRPPHVDSLYAWKLARHCNGDPNCTEVPYGDNCTTELPLGREMWVGFRAYVEPATKIGPAFSELLYDRVVKFTPAAPHITNVTVSPEAATDIDTGVPVTTPVTITFRPVPTPIPRPTPGRRP